MTKLERFSEINNTSLEIYSDAQSLERLQHNLEIMESRSGDHPGLARIVELVVEDIKRRTDRIMRLADGIE